MTFSLLYYKVDLLHEKSKWVGFCVFWIRTCQKAEGTLRWLYLVVLQPFLKVSVISMIQFSICNNVALGPSRLVYENFSVLFFLCEHTETYFKQILAIFLPGCLEKLLFSSQANLIFLFFCTICHFEQPYNTHFLDFYTCPAKGYHIYFHTSIYMLFSSFMFR